MLFQILICRTKQNKLKNYPEYPSIVKMGYNCDIFALFLVQQNDGVALWGGMDLSMGTIICKDLLNKIKCKLNKSESTYICGQDGRAV